MRKSGPELTATPSLKKSINLRRTSWDKFDRSNRHVDRGVGLHLEDAVPCPHCLQKRPIPRGERLQIMLKGEELTALDDFRFKRRMPTRAAAVRELLKRGLAAEGFEASPFGAKSEDYGVIGTHPKGRKGR